MEEKVKYYLKWKNTTVGVVYTNDNNEYKYIPDIENIRKLSKDNNKVVTDYFSIEECEERTER